MSTQQTAKTHYVNTPDGAKFAYRRIGTGLGTPLVLITHFRGTMDKWDPLLINSLAASRPIITVDYPGVGLSTGEVATSVRQSAANITTFLELICQSEVDLLGFSLGGYVAQMVALNSDPSKVKIRKLILAGTGLSYGPKLATSPNQDIGSVAAVKDATIDTFKTLFFPKNREGDAAAESWWSRIHERSRETCGEEVSQWLSHGFKDQGKGLLRQGMQGQSFTTQPETGQSLEGSYDRLQDLKTPVLVANGHDDYMIPTSNSYLIYQLVPNGQLILYPNSGHGFLFQYATVFAKHVLLFLEL
ncbi:Alpha/Beta hydrolase protein [Dactylonectria estremocensis]|uniref:Alpha/Beta hydrolase protein n=1 Tax=Dactylonectria estremocensis TaxID=1079267 RepID=A0A9P9ETI9_9HYPO|nr:Alpha/Beta hydrolase protein [Dactylonectria estremocensis]